MNLHRNPVTALHQEFVAYGAESRFRGLNSKSILFNHNARPVLELGASFYLIRLSFIALMFLQFVFPI